MASNGATRTPASSRDKPFRSLPSFVLALTVPLLTSTVCYTVALTVSRAGVLHELLKALGDAALVACALAVIGDIYLRRRLTEESIRRGVRSGITEMFGLFSATPEILRSAIVQFGNAHVFARAVTWRVNVAWQDQEAGILAITLRLDRALRVVSKDGYLPSGDLTVLHSTERLRSSHQSYRLHCRAAGIDVSANQAQLVEYCRPKNGQIALEQDRLLRDRLPDGVAMERDQRFTMSHSALMYRHSSGYLPLIHLDFERSFAIEVSGPAVPDLKISAFHPTSREESHRKFDSRHGGPLRAEWRNVIPGQGTILSWRMAGRPEIRTPK